MFRMGKIIKKKQQRTLGLFGILEKGTSTSLRFIGTLRLRQETINKMCVGDICLDETTGTIKVMTRFGLLDVG